MKISSASTRITVLAAFTLLSTGTAIHAADAAGPLARLIPAQKANDDAAHRYVFLENAKYLTYLNGGPELRANRSEESEVIFVEGIAYKKLVSRNGQPLSAKEQAEVEKTMKETAEYRRRNRPNPPGGKISLGRDHADLGSVEDFSTLFAGSTPREAEVRGRKVWLVELTPKENTRAKNDHERQVMKFRKTLWIDQQDAMLLRIVHTVVDPGMFAKPGTTVTLEFEKLPEGPYVPASVIIDLYRQVGRDIRPGGRTEYRFSRFRKFDVESTITVEQGH